MENNRWPYDPLDPYRYIMQIEIDDYLMFPNTEQDIREETNALAELLIAKNRAYGDSALDPMRCFSKADTVEQLKVRIDDKLSRMMRGKETDAFPEDLVKDLLGYLILLRVAEKRRQLKATNDSLARNVLSKSEAPYKADSEDEHVVAATFAEEAARTRALLSPEKSPRALMGS